MNHGDHDALPYGGHNTALADFCQVCGDPMPATCPQCGRPAAGLAFGASAIYSRCPLGHVFGTEER